MASTEASRRGKFTNHVPFPCTETVAEYQFTASVASSSEMSFADSTTAAKILPKKDSKKEKPTGSIKLKKSIAKKTTKPKDTESNGRFGPLQAPIIHRHAHASLLAGTNTAGATRSPSPLSPTVGGATTSKADGGDRPGTSKCKNCSKPVENAHFEAHVKHCQEQKKTDQKKAREAKKAKDSRAKAKDAEEGKDKTGDGDSIAGGDRPTANGTDKLEANGDASSQQATKKVPSKKSAPATTTKTTDGPKKNNKKRKGDEIENAEKEPKKKKAKKAADAGAGITGTANTADAKATTTKDDPPKPKLPKPKGPVNVELQCGVALPNGGFCARSLTCKSHSMGSKRSVPGRSAPYDTLLQQYQKKNQAKQQKLALANQALEHNAEDADGAEGAPVDSEEEREAVMRAVTRGWGGRPAEQYVPVSSRRRYGAVRRREGLAQALAGGKLFAAAAALNGLEGGGGGRSASIAGGVGIGGASPDLGGQGEDVASRRASLAQALGGKGGGGGGGGSRKTSLSGGGGSAGP